MGLLDEILKQLEEAQQQSEGGQRRPPPRTRPQPSRTPERESDEDGAEWEEDEAARPGHAPHIPSRHAPPPETPPVPEPEPARTTVSSRPELAHHMTTTQPATRIRALISTHSGIRDALIAREILGPPPGLKRLQRRR